MLPVSNLYWGREERKDFFFVLSCVRYIFLDSIYIEAQNTALISNIVQYQENGNHVEIAKHHIHIYTYSRVQVTEG